MTSHSGVTKSGDRTPASCPLPPPLALYTPQPRAPPWLMPSAGSRPPALSLPSAVHPHQPQPGAAGAATAGVSTISGGSRLEVQNELHMPGKQVG
jgi:hypothetical protein